MPDSPPIRVMVIDDSPEFSESIKLVLSLDPRFSDDVHLAESGEQGVADLGIFDPDLVLVDRMLPGMDGLETARLMKSQCPKAKLLLMTADPDPTLNTASIAAGLVGAIPKSQIDSTRLLNLLTA